MNTLNQVLIVFLKELKMIIRDRKTFFFGLLMPFLLVPSMLLIVDFSMKSSQNQVSNKVTISMSNTDNCFYNFCKFQDSINVIDLGNIKPEAALESGKISAFVLLDEELDQKILNGDYYVFYVNFNESSLTSMMAMPILSYYESLFKDIADRYGIRSKEILYDMTSMRLKPYSEIQTTSNFDMSSLYFSMLVPFMLVLYCCIGSASTANDLSAGEKERGTLESLLSTSASRTAILVGKLIVTTVMGVIGGLSTIVGLWCYLLISSSNQKHVNIIGFVTLFLITFFTSMFFASINLLIGVYSRSTKEAQTYLAPISVVCFIPAYFTYTLDAGSVTLEYLCVPVLNVICIIKEIFSNAVVLSHVLIVILWLLIYISAIFFVTSSMFKKESVVFRI
ncbi:MAG: sodium ABC transporter [Candidatus Paraimprobicoccus trichonymphae]|uniref:Sodium ABC transporter n=1 Tax=Candidatus Paraimprobicoccus trichonymphae TaxID=3033793 RepID=A0AA48IA27_9FIRM|nr:MAG: sodium ABC transporter [Candidatus Paraimprobicoccus trichonymphae]